MSWGTYAYLSEAIELTQAATVKLPSGTGVMISGQFVLTAAHVVIENNELAPNQTAINLWGETRAVINAYFDIAADIAVLELESPFQGLCRSRNKNEILLRETNYKNEEESIKGNPFRAPIFSL